MVRRRILIVQSDADLAEAIRQGLASAYETEVAADVHQAQEAFCRTRPDLILLDLLLSRGSGVHLLDFLGGLAGPVPPVILTGRHQPDAETNPFLHLIASFLPKPFHFSQLMARVDAALTTWSPPTVTPAVLGEPQVLLVEPDHGLRDRMEAALIRGGVRVVTAVCLAEATLLLDGDTFDLVICDWILPDGIGREMVERSRAAKGSPPVIILSANIAPQFARRVLTLGAADLLPHSADPSLLLLALEKSRFQAAPLFNREKLAAAKPPKVEPPPRRSPAVGSRNQSRLRYCPEDILGVSPPMQRARMALQQIARTESTVLLTGETGTGKELFAQALHQLSPRRSGPFVAVNAAAIPEQLLEAELFGYSSGAFTGAKKEGHRGRFQQASGGTLFLDEIGDLPIALQSKLLRVLQEGEIDPVGGDGPQRVDVRLVVATHRNLGEMVEQGLFRSDLYYRLNVVNITIPPLRDRVEDVGLLTDQFLHELSERYNLPPKRFSLDALQLLQVYEWPGNVRELRNVVEHAFVFTPGETIFPANLPPEVLQGGNRRRGPGSPVTVRSEREAIRTALERTGGNKVQAARLLGISRAGLYNKLKQYGIGC